MVLDTSLAHDGESRSVVSAGSAASAAEVFVPAAVRINVGGALEQQEQILPCSAMCGRLTEDEQEQERAEPRSAFGQGEQLSVEHQQASAEAASSP